MTAVHRVEPTGPFDGTFTCDGGPDDECHQYPSCDCETWPCEHPEQRQASCWITPWLNGTELAATYQDDDGADDIPDEWRPGVIVTYWTGDDVAWKYDTEREATP